MPTTVSGRGSPVETCQVGGDRSHRSGELALGDDPVEAVALGEPRRTDVEAETLVDLVSLAEGELGTAAAGIEHDE